MKLQDNKDKVNSIEVNQHSKRNSNYNIVFSLFNLKINKFSFKIVSEMTSIIKKTIDRGLFSYNFFLN